MKSSRLSKSFVIRLPLFLFSTKKISKDETDDSDYVVSFITISLGCYLRIPSGQGNIMVNILRFNSFLNCQFISFGARKKKYNVKTFDFT